MSSINIKNEVQILLHHILMQHQELNDEDWLDIAYIYHQFTQFESAFIVHNHALSLSGGKSLQDRSFR